MPSRKLTSSVRRVLGAALTLSTLLPHTGCRDEPEVETGISRAEYIETYIEILQAADAAPDSFAASDSARAILARRGLSEEDLLEFGRRHMDDPDYLAGVWAEIEERLRRPHLPEAKSEQPRR